MKIETCVSVWIALLLGAIAAVSGSSTIAQESSIPLARGPVVLEVSGHTLASAPDQAFAFDIAGLESLGTAVIRTETPWTTGVITFTGARLRDILKAVGAQDMAVTATALNDYSTKIPEEDFETYDVVVATRRDGNLMSVRDRGPLWVIYPWSERPELRKELYYSRSVWQLSSLEILGQ